MPQPLPSSTDVLVELIDTISETPAPRVAGVTAPLELPIPPSLAEADDGRQGALDEPGATPL
jgi:hypothetical protein